MTTTAYLAAEGYIAELAHELGAGVLSTHGRLIVAEGRERPAAWAANVWRNPQTIAIASIGDAAKKLRAIQRNWALYTNGHHRRAALIVEKLPSVSAKPLVFGQPPPAAPLGSFTLLDPATMLAAADCASPFPNGECQFVEDRAAPPSRAYLKLWELFTRVGVRPGPGDLCLDLGAAPGGWSFVLQGLGARVIAVDKAPLDPRIAALANVEVLNESAFGLDPRRLGPVDWLCCDVICYPERLYAMVSRWIAAGTARRFVCSVKFQGATDHATAAKFAAVPGSRLMHLSANKHELTWVKLG